MSKNVGMSMSEIDRLTIIKAVVAGDIKPSVAALRLNVGPRQVRRLVARYEAQGTAGLVSLQRGKASNRQLAPGLAQAALALLRERYADFGPTFAAEKLSGHHGLTLSKETTRKLMTQAGLWVTREERQARLHQPRNRRACFGELVQIDGSLHSWFEQRGPACTLLVFVDDATGRIMQLHFAPTESTFSYFAATRNYIAQHGKPLILYSDRAAVFRSPTNRQAKDRTQFHRALGELGIELICANSPQAKGRVERMNRTLQDRLVKELRLAGISTIAEGNAASASFIDGFNRQFAKAPRSTLNLHMPLKATDNPALSLAWLDSRKLTAKLTLPYKDRVIVLSDSRVARQHIGQRVNIHTFDAGNIEIRAAGIVLPYTVLALPSKAAPPIEVDSKELAHVVQGLLPLKKARARPYRNLTGAQTNDGVSAAKQLAARKKGHDTIPSVPNRPK